LRLYIVLLLPNINFYKGIINRLKVESKIKHEKNKNGYICPKFAACLMG